MRHVVTGPLAVAEVEGVSKYLAHGAEVPSTAANLAHLVEVGLVAEVEDPKESEDAEEAPSDDLAEVVDKPVEDMTVAELKAYAEAHGIDLGGVTRKDDIAAIIADAK